MQRLIAGTSAGIGGTEESFSAAGAKKGAMKGGMIGAGIGTMFGPGIGTAIGGAIGAIAGGILGFVGGKNIAKTLQKVQEGLKDLVYGVIKIITFPGRML